MKRMMKEKDLQENIKTIEELKSEISILRKERKNLVKNEKELREKNDELQSLEENYAASLEEARAITDELLQQNKILAENEDKFRTLTEIVPAAIFIVQGDKYIYTNKAFHEITGVDENQLNSMFFWDIVHADYQEILKKRGYALQKNEQVPERYEFVVLNPLKGNRWIDFSAAHFEYEGKPAMLGIAIDITTKKEAAKSLTINKFSVEKAFDSILWLQKDGSFIYANKSACDMLGYTLKELLKLKIFDIAPEFQSEKWPQHWNELRLKSHMVFETVHRTKRGKDIPVETAINYMIYEGEEYNFAFSRDITERKLNQNLLIESEEKFRNIFNSINDAIFIQEKETNKILSVNYATCRMFGYAYDEFEKLSIEDLSLGIPPYSAKEAFEFNRKAKSEGPQTFEWISKSKDDKLFNTEVTLRLAKIGNFERVIAVARDISKRKKAEEDLIKAKNRAEEADRLKSAFLANMSHEIRTPMNGILGFTDLLIEEEVSNEERESYLNIIKKNGDQLLNIINDILDLSKIEVGQLKLAYENLNVHNLFKELETTFVKHIYELKKDLVLTTEIEIPDKTTIYCDPTRIRQIFNNLLSNALKFTEKGEINIGFKKDENFYMFWVKDTGIGLNKKEQSVIFERFIQVDIGHSRRHSGTGLGLSIIKGLVDLMNGKIRVDSKPGVGSTFYFTIPQVTKPK